MPLNIDRIHKPVRKLRKFLKKAPKRPTPDAVHSLRTNARRLEITVDAFGLAFKGNERRLLRDLSRIRKRAGKVRDRDVLTAFASNLDVDGEQDCLVELLEHLRADRRKHAKKLRAVAKRYGPALRSRLKRSASHMEELIAANGNNVTATRPAEAAAKALELVQQLREPPRLNRKNLHPYRLKVKQLRYLLQLADHADQHEFVDKLGEVKDAIGEWHDVEELIVIAGDVLDHGSQCKLMAKLREISNKKYQHALALTNRMRATYLDTKQPGQGTAALRVHAGVRAKSHRRAQAAPRTRPKRPTQIPTLPRPVLTAASALAS
jgi:CHAD domain-containing protein